MLLSEVASRFSAESLITSGFVIYEGFMPATPDKVIALYERQGTNPEMFFLGETVEQPMLTVWTRGAKFDQATPRAAIETIFQAVVDWGAFTAGGVRYLGLTPMQSPFLLDKDGNERWRYVVNFLVQKELS